MSKTWLIVSHIQQRAESDCLPMWVQRELAFLGRNESYERLTHLLGTRWFGTPARNIVQLEQIGFRVPVIELSIVEIENHLQNGRAVIAFVNTADLPYWNVNADHAVVVVGIDETNVYLDDPYFQDAPQVISNIAFELALLRFNNQYVIIER